MGGTRLRCRGALDVGLGISRQSLQRPHGQSVDVEGVVRQALAQYGSDSNGLTP